MTARAHQSINTPARTAIPAVASLTVDPERLARMWALSPAERIAAAQRGQFTLGEMLRWAARAPAGEVPLIDGEFFFITALTADDNNNSSARGRMSDDDDPRPASDDA